MNMIAKITTPLSRKSVLVAVVVNQWTARKLDRKATDETNARHNATKDAGRYNKLLIAAEHLAEVKSLVSQARTLHHTMTRPWGDEGARILPNVLFAKFSEQFRTIKRDFEIAADKFAAAYPAHVAERKQALGSLFNASDYPSASEIRSRYSMKYDVMPFPDADDFRSDLDDDTVAEIKEQLRETTDSVVSNAMQHTAQQIRDTVGHIVDEAR